MSIGLLRMVSVGRGAFPVIVGAACLLAACSGPDGQGAGNEAAGDIGARDVPSPAFGGLATLDDRIHLEEPDSAPITEITDLDVDAEGRLLVPDPAAGNVRVFGPDGSLAAVVGGRGRGPGEFRRPMFAAFGPEGGIYVTDAEQPRVTRFRPDLALDTVFRIREAFFGSHVTSGGGALAVFALRGGRDSVEVFHLYSPGGELRERFGRLPSELADHPGWMAAARSRLADYDGRFVAGFNLMYPLLLYEPGEGVVDSVGSPPATWRQASKPERGTFEGAEGRERLEEWRRTFTTISGLEVYRDSLLLVEHESLAPDVLEHRQASHRLDVYRLGARPEKIAEDVETPGRLLHADRDVYLLSGTPADAAGWIVSRYRLDDGGRDDE